MFLHTFQKAGMVLWFIHTSILTYINYFINCEKSNEFQFRLFYVFMIAMAVSSSLSHSSHFGKKGLVLLMCIPLKKSSIEMINFTQWLGSGVMQNHCLLIVAMVAYDV